MNKKYSDKLIKLGLIIRDKRINLNLTQKELADMISIERKHVSLIENGRQNLTMDTIYKISTALNTTIIDLLKEMDYED